MGRVARAWQLFKESFAVLAADEEMLLFPLLSGLSALLLGISFFIPLYQGGVFEAIRLHKAAWDS